MKKALPRVLIALVVLALALVGLTYAPLGASGRRVATRAQGGDWTWSAGGPAGTTVRLASTESREKSANAWQNLDEPLDVRRVWVQAQSDHPALVALGHAMQDDLLADGALAEVAFLPAGDDGAGLAGPPDVRFVLELVRGSEERWPGYQTLDLRLRCYADRRPPHEGAGGVVQPGAALMEASLDYTETAWGPLTRNARYAGAAEALLEVLLLEDRLARWRGTAPAAK